MYTIYQMHTDELDENFLQTLKTMFKGKPIEIAVCETAPSSEDETTYLLKSPANRQHLLTAIANVARRENLVTIDLEDWQ
jgi:hypothetical protein